MIGERLCILSKDAVTDPPQLVPNSGPPAVCGASRRRRVSAQQQRGALSTGVRTGRTLRWEVGLQNTCSSGRSALSSVVRGRGRGSMGGARGAGLQEGRGSRSGSQCPTQRLCARPTGAAILNHRDVCRVSAHAPEVGCRSSNFTPETRVV